jgi:outer membrane PBP1 activator LpoA protein
MKLNCILNDDIQKILTKIDELNLKLDKDSENNSKHVWLDLQDASDLLKITKRTLQNYRLKGWLPSSRIGGKVYYRLDDIEAFLRKNYSRVQNHPVKQATRSGRK